MPLSARETGSIFLILLLFAVGVAQIALEQDVARAFRQYALEGATLDTVDTVPIDGRVRNLNLVPQNLETAVTSVIEASGAIAITAGVVNLFFYPNRAHPSMPSWSFAAIAVTDVAATFATLAILIFVFVKESQNTRWHWTNPDSTPGTYTRESWACQMHRDIRPYRQGEDDIGFGPPCREAQAAKWFSIPALLILAAMSALSTAELLNPDRRPTAKEMEKATKVDNELS